ncbi:MAG: signal peptide peptidase SppA, partial [Gammaproteobacteria bacterium]|nr:signal peptide peptidase SppA [Gammaproteobacteria bacterium]
MAEQSFVIRAVKAVFRGIDRVRKVLHFVFLFTVLLLAYALWPAGAPVVPASAALVLNPQGALVDQLSGDPLQRAIAYAQGLAYAETLLPEMIEAVRAARDDDRIKALVLRVDGLGGAGLSKLQELAAEIQAFKERSGKPVYAYGASFDRNQYFLAAQADEIIMHPMGVVLIDGY